MSLPGKGTPSLKTGIFNLDSRILAILLLLVSIAALTPALTGPFIDSDFYWHLASGRWILEHGSLPEADPFAYTSSPLPEFRERFILRGFWLSQILYAAIYRMSGWEGLMVLRYMIVAGIGFLLWLRLTGLTALSRLLLVFLSVLTVVRLFPLDRPHLSSVVMAALLLLLLERLLKYLKDGLPDKRIFRTAAFMALAMVFWANMHPGYLLGQLVLVMAAASELLRFIHPACKPMDRKQFAVLLLVLGLVFVSGFLNPLGYKTVYGLLSMYSMSGGLLDYLDSVSAYRVYHMQAVAVYWLFLAAAVMAAVLMLKRREFDLLGLLMLAGLGYASFTQVRYIPFFVVWSVPFAAKIFSGTPALWLRRAVVVVSLLVFSYLMIAYSAFDQQNLSRISSPDRIGNYFPKAAAQFLETNLPEGKLFNYYDWGGYLIWRFYPQKRVFSDNRQLYEHVYFQGRDIENAEMEPSVAGRAFYKSLLDSYRIDLVLVPFYGVSGQILPLVVALGKDSEWVPVFLDAHSVIYAREKAENANVIRNFAIPKRVFIQRFLQRIDAMLRQYPSHTQMLLTSRADLYLKFGLPSEAAEVYEEILRADPGNKEARDKLALIKSRQGSGAETPGH